MLDDVQWYKVEWCVLVPTGHEVTTPSDIETTVTLQQRAWDRKPEARMLQELSM